MRVKVAVPQDSELSKVVEKSEESAALKLGHAHQRRDRRKATGAIRISLCSERLHDGLTTVAQMGTLTPVIRQSEGGRRQGGRIQQTSNRFVFLGHKFSQTPKSPRFECRGLCGENALARAVLS
jgi:hypothetical protein